MGKKEGAGGERVSWGHVFSRPTAVRFKLRTGQETIVDGVKVLCDSGFAEAAYHAVEEMLSRSMPILVGHLDFAPNSCRVVRAAELFPHEYDGYVFMVEGYSGASGDTEFFCIYINDVQVYARVCSRREVEAAWRVWTGER